MKIDLHTHILPRDWPDLDAKYGYGGFIRLDHYKPCCARMMIGDRVFREITDNVWDPKRRIEECDREKISMQVLSTVPVMFSYWAKPADALDLSRRLNDHIAEVVREHPTRFAGLATIPLQDPDLAAIELERCVRELGLRGVQIGTHVDANPHSGRIDTLNLDNASLQPVWNAAEQLGAFAHGGGAFPFTIGRIEHAFHVRPDLVSMENKTNPRKYLARFDHREVIPARFYVDSLVHDAGALRTLLNLFGARRIALGSDYPFPLGEAHPGEVIQSMKELSAKDKARLLSGTAREFLGMDSSHEKPQDHNGG